MRSLLHNEQAPAALERGEGSDHTLTYCGGHSMADSDSLTAQRLRELLHYDPDTGLFIWLARCSNRALPGSIAGGGQSQGYLAIGVDRRRYLAHRLAWLYMTGAWPAAQVDHIDRDRKNNRWSNLREATAKQNAENAAAHRDSASGVKGIGWVASRQKWVARICSNGERKQIGSFCTLEEAMAARQAAEAELFTHGVSRNCQ